MAWHKYCKAYIIQNVMYRPLDIGSLHLRGNLLLAPVAGWTDNVFRSLCVEAGADFSFTELISSEALTRGERGSLAKTEFLMRRGSGEKCYAIQLFGSDPDVMYRAALMLEPFAPDIIDINAGCPVPKVTKTGSGSALMRNPSLIGRVVEAVRKAAEYLAAGKGVPQVPVTIKIRSGWDCNTINYAECARAAVEAGVSMVTLHPRTKTQGYEGKSSWHQIADLSSRLAVPVTGSGDLYTHSDAARMFYETGCAAVMFARGAMGNPFIFRETKDFLLHGSFTHASEQERIAAAFRHLIGLCEQIGERGACLEMRKIFCAYTKGMQGGAALRNDLVHAATIAEYKNVFARASARGSCKISNFATATA